MGAAAAACKMAAPTRPRSKMAPPTGGRRSPVPKMAALLAPSCWRAGSKMAALRSVRLALGGVRFYNARPLRRRLGGVYRPDPENPRTPPWQLTAAYEAKVYGRHGSASGVDPAGLWPSPEKLREMEAEEKAWYPSLREMQERLDAKEQRAEAKRRAREEHIASQMAKMPEMIANWLREKEERKSKEREEKERRQMLLAEARERFGYNLDHRSAQFQEMVQEMEKARKKEAKLQKKQRREEALAKKAMQSAPVASLPDKEGEVVATEASHQVT
ncbi:arrest and DNA damage-inducible s-interacting 1 [Podarcis lilfordi]|uniref:Large ribosomal subunit protein mL64 n=1 Tax=Podarcis lilfordi TaxID=74358 RepID=A0AA35LH83_9SAUR|nr:arrest and DNA damage-inducible s-interacting 1 [Podarcis lilfordi]